MIKPFNLLTLLLFCCLFAAGQQTGNITGIIKDNQNDLITGANIILIPGSSVTTTDKEGRFCLNNIPAGEYTLQVSYIGYKTFTVQISMDIAENKEVDLVIQTVSIALNDITVTSQKRTEISKDVPIALSSISSGFLDNNVIETMGSMADFVPGVQVQEQSVVFPGFVIRGLTSDNHSLNVDNRVSVFQDGISVSKQIGAFTEFFDIDRVEVLKGPQGTLFGRSAQIGAIHLITKRATNTTSGNVTFGLGNYNQIRANGYINLPLEKDKLFVRVAGIYHKRDGYVENLSGGTLMGKNTLATRASIKYLPNQHSAFDLIFNYQRDRAPGTAFKSGVYAPKGGDTNPSTFADLEGGTDLTDSRDVYGITAQYKQYFSHLLSLTAISGYRTLTASSNFDSDGTKAQVLAIKADAVYNQFSQEIRLNYDGKRFSGFSGVNYFREYGNMSMLLSQDERSVFAMLSPLLAAKIPGFKPIPTIIDGEPNLSVAVNPLTGKPLKTFHTEKINDEGARNSAFDVFADGTYKLTSKLKITAGTRMIFEDQRSFYRIDPADDPGTLGFLLQKGSNNLFKPTDGLIEESKTFTGWVGRLVLQYDFSGQVSTYASWSKGRRPNVIQISTDTIQFLDAEVVYNYEAGIKTLLMNKRLMINFSGFCYDYSHFQTVSFDIENAGISRFTDSGKALGLGIETDLQFAATKRLTLFANYAWLDAQFNHKDSYGNEQQLAGNNFRLSPVHSGAAGLSYRFDLGKSGCLELNLSVTGKSGHYFDDDNTPGLYQDSYLLFNSALQYAAQNGKYGMRLNMNNLTNKRYIIDAGNTGQSFGIPTFVPGAPRFYGVQFFVNL